MCTIVCYVQHGGSLLRVFISHIIYVCLVPILPRHSTLGDENLDPLFHVELHPWISCLFVWPIFSSVILTLRARFYLLLLEWLLWFSASVVSLCS